MSQPAGRHRITRAFSEIAQTLESADDAADRIKRSLGLLREVVPYERCALLSAPSRATQELFTVPELAADPERGALQAKLATVLRITVDGTDEGRVSERYPHLTLPVVGLDRVIGVLRVEPPEDVSYDADHVGLLSIACAQIGAYLTGLQLRDDQARRLHDLQAAHDFQRLLVGVVGHDLRAPLGVILAGAGMLQHPGVGHERQVDVAVRIQKNVRRAARIIDDLLDVTQIQLAGGLQLRRERINLRALVVELAQDVQLANPQRRIVVETPEERVDVDCDPDRIGQVFTNLVGNALRYGDPTEPIRVDVRRTEDRATLAVRNRGPQIAPDLLPHIFDPFKRGAARDTSNRTTQSLGLGLYIVAEIVRGHQGRIDVRSNPEETAFTLSMPRHLGARPEGTPLFASG